MTASAPRVWYYDAEATLEDLNPSFMAWYAHMSPFGAQFALPLFRLSNVKIQQVKELKGGHYRLTLSDGMKLSRVALWFSPPKNHPLLLDGGLRAGIYIDALVEPQWNYFAGNRTLQLLIQELRAAESSRTAH